MRAQARIFVWLGVGWLVASTVSAQVIVTNAPVSDAFVRSADPTHNYGAAGALAVSGSIATNPTSGLQQGLLDSFLQFNVAGDITTFNTIFGAGQWTITNVTLVVTAQSANNADFNYGSGSFEVRWIGNNSWLEGTGTPMAPGSSGITYSQESSILNPGVDQSLGTFTYNGATSGQVKLLLGSATSFISDLSTGTLASLYMTATPGSMVGFTFNSRNFGTSSAWPMLDVTAVAIPEPSTITLIGLSIAGLVAMRRRGVRR